MWSVDVEVRNLRDLISGVFRVVSTPYGRRLIFFTM